MSLHLLAILWELQSPPNFQRTFSLACTIIGTSCKRILMVATNARSFFGRSKTVSSSVRTSNSSTTPTNWSTSASTPTPHGVTSTRHRVRCPRSDSGSQTPSRYGDQRSVRTRSELYQPGMLLQEFPSTLPRYSAKSENDEGPQAERDDFEFERSPTQLQMQDSFQGALLPSPCHRVACTLMVNPRRTRLNK